MKSHYKNHNTMNIAQIFIVSVHHLFIKEAKLFVSLVHIIIWF